MTNKTQNTDIEEVVAEIESKFAEQIDSMENGGCGSFSPIMDEFRKALATNGQKIREETEKAFGGCKKCYGKGYSTQKENYTGYGEHDIGQGGIEIFEEAQYYLPCTCDRGKQIKKLLQDITTHGQKMYERGYEQGKNKVVDWIRGSSIWQLVPNTPRKIMCSDKELDDLLEQARNK